MSYDKVGRLPRANPSILMEQTEFTASKAQYTALKQELDEFRGAANVSVTHSSPEDAQ
jgi:hypothetical protein